MHHPVSPERHSMIRTTAHQREERPLREERRQWKDYVR
jgi:hypothetical protein